MDESRDSWMNLQGRKFLTDIGMKKDQVVLDFGCGHGAYTIPAAMVVGENGRVYAVDIKRNALNEVNNNAKKRGLRNILCIEAPDQIDYYVSPESVDMILLYDMLHLIKARERLLSELFQLLKRNGVLSVFPKHHQTDMHMKLSEVKKEIESAGFLFDLKLLKMLMHNDQLEKGYILNFKKG